MIRRLRHILLPVIRRVLPAVRPIWRRVPVRVRRRIGPLLKPALNPSAVAAVRRAHALVPVGPSEQELPPPTRRVERASPPAVSIVVPAHDDGLYLWTCLMSVRSQGFESWECIVVDDCSIDDTAAVIAEFAALDDRFVAVRHDRNIGLAGTRNTGIALATGEYLTFLDADDFLFQDSLADRHAHALAAGDPRVVGSWCDWAAVPEAAGLDFVPPGAEKSGLVDYRSGGGANQFISTSPLLRTDVVRSLGGFDDSFRTAEDFEFWTRLFRNGFALVGTGSVGVAYRQKRVSMVSADPLGHARNASAVHDYMSRPMTGPAMSALAVKPFVQPEPGVPVVGSLAERFVSFLTFAHLTGDADQVAGVRALIRAENLVDVDVDEAIHRALARHSLRVGGLPGEERERIRTVILDELSRPVALPAPPVAHEGAIDLARVRPAAAKARPAGVSARVRRGRRLPLHRGWDVVLSGATTAGVADLLALGRELVDEGASVAVCDPETEAGLRHRAHVEGIRVVVHPTGPTGLEISADGVDRGIPADSRVVVCAEPWLSLPGGTADLVLARSPWEVELWRSAGHAAELGGWPSRASRLESIGRPRDGDAHRGRLDTVLVVRAPGDSEGPGRAPLRASLGDDIDLVYGPRLSAPASELVIAPRLPILMGRVRAVVVAGEGVPVDALMHGTPVVALVDELPVPVAGVRTSTVEGLAAALDDVEAMAPAFVDEDWLARQLLAVRSYLR